MTEPVTRDRLGQADATPETERAALLAEVRGSVLRLLADLPARPGRLRITALDIAVEVEWPATEQWTSQPVPPAAAAPMPAATSPGGPSPSGAHRVTAATVGTFYRKPEPGAPSFVAVGDHVRAGQQLAIVEAMKLMIPVEADADGRIREILKDDGDPVEFGEPLFLIERD